MDYFNAVMKRFCLAVILLSIIGCTSKEAKVNAHMTSWISRPLSELKIAMKSPDSYASKVDWDETTYQLANGYYIFVEPFSKDCFIHWKINPRDIIIGYFVKGVGCSDAHRNDEDVSEIDRVAPAAP